MKLNNEHSQWVDPEKVKIGRCVKCNGHQSVGWLFPHLAWYRDYCLDCNDFRKFVVQPSLKYVPPTGQGYVVNGISTAINKIKQ